MPNKYLKQVWEIIAGLLLSVVILYLNYSIIKYFFLGEFNQNIASIEISYIQMAKFWSEGGGLWQPLWYLGYPWHVFYTPLLPFLELVANKFAGFSFPHAYRVITAGAYVFVPVSLFLFAWQISKSKTGAFISALWYTFLPSLIALIFKEVAQDSMTGGLEPRRFAILVRWGEGPHTLALVFLPIFGLFLAKYFDNRKPLNLFLASLFLGLCALTNAIVLWAALLLSACFLIAEATTQTGKVVSAFKGFFKIFILAFGLISFWYNLPFLGTFFREGGGSLNNLLSLFPWMFISIIIGASFIILICAKISRGKREISFSILWFLVLFTIVYVYYASGEERIELVPQALRLTTEVDLALSLLIGVIFSKLFLYMWKLKKLEYVSQVSILLLFVVVCSVLILSNIKLLREISEFAGPRNEATLEKTAEFKAAKEIEALVGGSSERVLVPGNYSFWLNYFIKVPQLRGALYQSSTNHWPEHVYYQITNGDSPYVSLAWLKIANIGKLVYTDKGSAETYKDFKVGKEKFDRVLEIISEKEGDIYYKVPLKNSNLVKVIDIQGYSKLGKPTNAIDEGKIYPYLSWIEEKSEENLKVVRVSNSKFKVSGTLPEGEGLLLQETYDAGWHIKDRNLRWKKLKDPMDFMVFIPNKSGEINAEIFYGRPFSVYFGYLISVVSLAVFGFLVFKRKKNQPQSD